MTVKEYAEKLNKLLADRPEKAEFVVVTAKDDEGNGFNLVHYDPSVGNYEDREFTAEKKPNAVCLN